MKRHEKPKLKPVGPLKCPECDKSFEIKKYLTAHRKTHEKGIAKEKNLKCTICSYQTNKRSNLNQHMNTHQPNTLPPIKSYSCKICALPVEAESFINYLRSIKELHSATVSKEFNLERCEKAVFDFEILFWYLHEL